MWHDYDPSQDAVEEEPATNGTNGVHAEPAPVARVRDYKDVIVTFVDPSNARLKIQLLGSGKQNLESLMKDFASFHVSPQNSAALGTAPKVGDVVSAKFTQDGVWYRARVRRNDREAKKAEVVYIDYGNSEMQPWSALRPLNNDKFGTQKLKPQAMDAALSFLQFPMAPDYLAEAVSFLNDIAADRALVANVDFTDQRDNNLLWVTLMDPQASRPQDSLNAEVVSEGLAMVPKKLKPWERAAADIVTDLKGKEEVAKKDRRGMWEYGDITED